MHGHAPRDTTIWGYMSTQLCSTCAICMLKLDLIILRYVILCIVYDGRSTVKMKILQVTGNKDPHLHCNLRNIFSSVVVVVQYVCMEWWCECGMVPT